MDSEGMQTQHLEERLTQLSTIENLEADIKDRIDQALQGIRTIDIEKDLRKGIDEVYKARNLIRLLLSGIKIEGDMLTKIADDSLENVELIPVEQELIESLAKQLYKSANTKEGDALVIRGSPKNIQILEAIARLCIKDGMKFIFDFVNNDIEAILINKSEDEGIDRLAEEEMSLYKGINKRVTARNTIDVKFDDKKKARYDAGIKPLTKTFKNGERHYTLTVIPTKKDAEADGLNYEEYLKLFFEACDQPWEEIKEAQKILIERFNKGKKIHITNKDGTNLHLETTGQTYANSVALKNIPGCEVFTGPIKDSLNGTIVANGKFSHEYGKMEDITLVFDKGRVVDFDAKKGRDVLEKIIKADDGEGEGKDGNKQGTRYAGEIAFGGNPHLRRHFVNELLVEKIGGSFHIALGEAYDYTEYDSVPVKVDNGNRSASDNHWDITTMLMGKEGIVELDGVVIQKDGVWVDKNGNPDERLEVLSKGWGVIPKEKQPEWWKKNYPNGY